ncbi:hypothetical protein [Desulfovibrio sp. Huiquan2017]|uniref:hypothetical protein n=1 Tax=Desulfovibrio sp. Huiquan2017 TaxID=2816861 RepID=UPI001A91096D|nr:hypothetical protein [Desulfovibrio sp. Huiquan2017]
MRNILIYIAMVGIMLQAGCGTMFENDRTSPEFGSSVRMAVASQTANPEAGGDAPVVGIDGQYAAAMVARYQAGPSTADDSDSGAVTGDAQ